VTSLVVGTAIFWGMFSYSLAVLGIVTGLSIKVALLFRDRGVLRRELDGAERRAKDANDAVKGVKESLARYKRELGVLRDELEKTDDDLDPIGVADRLKRLLSGKVSNDDRENGEGGSPVSVTRTTETDPG
jgi:hypothetical protein